jgi:hypothetical protein
LIKQNTAELKQQSTFSVRQPAEVSNARKTLGQHVLQKPAEELGAGESHGALLVVIRIILPAEPDLRIGDGENPMVGDGDAMRIASQVLQNVVWTAKRRLRIHDPILLKQGSQEPAEVAFIRQRQTLTEERESFGVESASQASAELATKDAAQDLYRQKEIRS